MTDNTSTEANRTLWIVGIAIYVVGDTLTTSLGVNAGAVESNPVVAHLLQSVGILGVLALKLAVVTVAALGYQYIVSREARIGIPLGLIAVGTIITASNLLVIA